MHTQTPKAALLKAGLAASLLLLGSGAALAQTVYLTAAPATATLPDGTAVPMWGYSCGAGASGATCAPLNAAAAGNPAIWSPVVITVPYAATGTSLTVSLSNNLFFSTATGPNSVPTSLTIVGQLGGGLGGTATATGSPAHAQLGVSWSTVNTPGGTNPTFTPPLQPERVQSFSTEVIPGATIALVWNNLRPGTYLIESGTHPSIQGPMGLYGMLVVTTPPVANATAGCAYPSANGCAVPYDTDVPLLFSEIDPVQNGAVAAAVATPGFSETMVWSGQPGGCGNPASPTYNQCYPPAVNYLPVYYLINGVAFNTTAPSASLFAASAPVGSPPLTGTTTGTALVRLVNAGLKMHVPSIVGSQTSAFTTTPTAAAGTLVTASGFTLIAQDGNPLPPAEPRVQNEVFMAAGKTYDVMINAPAAGSSALPVYDRELSLSGNQIERNAGMLAYIGINGAGLPSGASQASSTAAIVRNDAYPSLLPVAGQTLTVLDPAKGVIANDTNVYGVQLLTPPVNGTVTLNANGTFTYVSTSNAASDSFQYCANGAMTQTTPATCPTNLTGTVSLTNAAVEGPGGITVANDTFTSNVATGLSIKPPGILANDSDAKGYPLQVLASSVVAQTGLTVSVNADGSFSASVTAPGTYTFAYAAQNSQGTASNNGSACSLTAAVSGCATVTLVFPQPTGLQVTVLDGYDKTTAISDYRWVIEEDQTFYYNPTCTTNPPPAGCPGADIPGQGVASIVLTQGVNFHTSHMPLVATGCTGPLSCEGGQMVFDPASGNHINAVCDVGNGVCRPDTSGNGFAQLLPGQVALDPTKRYYISVLPGDAANPFQSGYAGVPCGQQGADPTKCVTGHGMGGAPIGPDPYTHLPQTSVTILTQPSPYPPSKLSVFVFEDDFPLNGEQDGGGGIDVLSPQEPGLGGFQIHLWDAMGGNGDFTGQMTYDMFNQPLTNSLDGTVDPNTGLNACPITQQGLNSDGTSSGNGGITGMIVTCPKYEGDGQTLSPLAGQAVIANLMPGRFGVVATPAADRIARGEEWLQTNTLDGQKAHDSFVRIGEPSYFQEYGPASFHVSIGFANPAIINARHQFVCNGSDANVTGKNCNNSIVGQVVGERLSRTPDERLYGSGSHDTYYWTQCYVSFGDPDGEDFAFTKCDANGNFKLTGLPDGQWRVTIFDQWNDQLVDGLSTPVGLGAVSSANPSGPSNCPGPTSTAGTTNPDGTTTGAICDLGQVAETQWQTNLYTRTFIDDNRDGISQSNETGIPFANVAVRLRDGSLENLLVTDFTGTANFNETFPLFSWYVVETDVTRYKNTGTHVVYDVGGPADGTLTTCGGALDGTGFPPCGTSTIGKYLANTTEVISVPPELRVPGSIYCADADCTNKSMNPVITGGASTNQSDSPSSCSTSTDSPPITSCSATLSSGRIDSPWLGGLEGWQGFPGQNSFLEFGKAPYAAGENGGIHGHVVYASTRPFDDPMMLVQTQWTPLVPHVTINLYQEGFAADGVTPTLTLVDTTQTSSFDDWAQGFHTDASGNRIPNMNCPGQGASSGANPDLFFFTLFDQPDYLDWYNSQHGGAAVTQLPYSSQFKCYDGMHNWNQLQPAPYDGMYQFPSVTSYDPATGKPNGTNCKICGANPAKDIYGGLPMLPTGKYVVEVVVPPGFELVKEEDKNILIGDNFIAPVTQEFGALGNVFILPDQASVASAYTTSGVNYNANNAQNSTVSLGTSPNNGIVPGFIPEPTWPCVGAARVVPDYISLYPQTHQVSPFAGATRRLCDRKEVTLDDQAGAIAKFYLYTSAHIASKFTGGITDDYTSEFDPFSPQFGEKFSPPDLPVSVRDWAGNEISRVYADHWGTYDGMTYSTWEVNPPNPTGYSPTMMVFCMNDPGPILDTRPGSATNGQMITDPLFAPGYSQFCYELPFMPGTTQYLDTPVVPTSAFAGAGYNNVDCAYPDLTPAVSSVTGDVAGPWVSQAGNTLTINGLGDSSVPNNAYSGPSATTAPYNQKTIVRHYGFGAAAGTVTIGGVAATVANWSDTQIQVAVPAGVPNCAIQQQAIYGGSTAQCGELVVTTAGGKKSVDTVTVTIGGKTPTVLAANAATTTPMTQNGPGAIQQAIDAAAPGDLIIVPPGTYYEMVLMWKPVRLQGVGGASSIINAQTQPAGKMDPWRRQVDCLFGLAMNGYPVSAANAFDPSATYSCPGNGWNYFVGNSAANGSTPQVDRLPLEATLGWDASLNGNMAELLQEPSLMGALEGAGITVLAKGVDFHGQNPNDPSLLAAFPDPTTLLTANDCLANGSNPNPSNFQCNPASIDGLGITQSSQGGGGIFVHGWGHNLQIANNRVHSNAGTLSGGINIGQGEFAPSYTQGGGTNAAPGSCETSSVNGQQLPYCQNLNVNVHNNYVSLNSSTGDELFSATPAGAGGVSICTGADYYKFNYNWVCGNLSSGDGGGLGHLGFSKNGDIEYNTFVFNQSINPTIPANGGGLVIMGTPDADPTCGATTDADCVATPGSIGPSDGVGPGLVINANLIMGNAAESGTGGGIAFQNVNGSDVVAFPANPENWHHVVFTNNIVVDNVAGWDGGGVSLLDALNIDIVNNTIAANVTTASSGILFNTLGAPLASQHGPTCTANCGKASAPQPAGLVAIQNSAVLQANLPATVDCPANHFSTAGGASAANGTCRSVSYPLLANNILWQNAAYQIRVGALSAQYQQNVVGLYNAVFDGTLPAALAATQAATGACVPGASFWDLGVRGDGGPANHGSGFTLAPSYSLLTSTSGYDATNIASNPQFVSQYCDGSRQPPEAGISGWQVPPGISDATVPNPIFNLTPVATVDEGNNWVNMRWGPLTMVNPVSGVLLGNYALASGSPAIDYVTNAASTYALAPTTDFFGNPRPDPARPGAFDIGAVEFRGTNPAATLTSMSPSSGLAGTSVNVTLTGTNLTEAIGVAAPGSARISVSNFVAVNATTATATLNLAAATAVGNHAIVVTTPSGNTNGVLFAVTGRTLTSIAPASGVPGTSVNVTLTGTGLTGATAVTAPGSARISVSNFVAVNDTTVTATLNLAAGTAVGNHAIEVTTPSGNTNAVMFAVVPPPALTSIAPASGVPGTSVNVTLTGTGLTGATAVTAPGSARITVSNFVAVNDTTVTATLNLAAGTAVGNHAIEVTTPSGNTNAVMFAVVSPAALTSIAPASGVPGTSVNVTLTGTGLTGATAVTAPGSARITVSNFVAVNATTVTATLNLAAGTAVGNHAIEVTTPSGGTNAVMFAVN